MQLRGGVIFMSSGEVRALRPGRDDEVADRLRQPRVLPGTFAAGGGVLHPADFGSAGSAARAAPHCVVGGAEPVSAMCAVRRRARRRGRLRAAPTGASRPAACAATAAARASPDSPRRATTPAPSRRRRAAAHPQEARRRRAAAPARRSPPPSSPGDVSCCRICSREPPRWTATKLASPVSNSSSSRSRPANSTSTGLHIGRHPRQEGRMMNHFAGGHLTGQRGQSTLSSATTPRTWCLSSHGANVAYAPAAEASPLRTSGRRVACG